MDAYIHTCMHTLFMPVGNSQVPESLKKNAIEKNYSKKGKTVQFYE